MDGIISASSWHNIQEENVEVSDHLHLSEGVEFLYRVIGNEIAKTVSSKSFKVQVILKLASGREIILIERLHIPVSDCSINEHVSTWCEDKNFSHLELLANFIGDYLGLEIKKGRNETILFIASATITQCNSGHPAIRSMSVTKPIQDLLGLFVPEPSAAP